MRTLDPHDWSALYGAQQEHPPDGSLSASATKEFILRHVFGIDPALVQEDTDLLHLLLKRHYGRQRIPPALDDLLVDRLKEQSAFSDWPLERIVPSDQAFYGFLQERWPAFLRRIDDAPPTREPPSAASLQYEGPPHLPFGHDEVRPYVDSLFLDGLLAPASYRNAKNITQEWARVGLRIDEAADRRRRFERLLQALREDLPTSDDRYTAWQRYAYRWAELAALRYQLSPNEREAFAESHDALRAAMDEAFAAWTDRRYAGLHNLPGSPPVMLHHAPQALARHLTGASDTPPAKRVALVVLDGLALDQWVVLREAITERRAEWSYHEQAVFAWLPTLTSVSRQALFAGTMPRAFPDSIYRTDREPALWERFWETRGLSPAEAQYEKVQGDPSDLEAIRHVASDNRVRALGLVCWKVDSIMHGMTMGTAGMHNQVQQWAESDFLPQLLDMLSDESYRIFLTSDHGNMEARGIGRPSEGATAEKRGHRARVYAEESLRKSVAEAFPEAASWPPVGLPEDYFPLLAPDRGAFVSEGKRLVAHGGRSLEELLVPFVHLETP